MDKPFQSYDDQSDAATCAPRLAALRAELKARGLDGFVVPHSDEHMGEYLPANAESLAVTWWPIGEVARLPLHAGFADAWPQLRRLLATA